MPRCNRCGNNAAETHEFRAVGGEGDLQRYRYADGAMIDGQKIDLCGSCKSEFISMLQSTKRAYSDPVLP